MDSDALLHAHTPDLSQPSVEVPDLTRRYDPDSDTTADYIVVEMARHLLGENWMREFVDKANRGGIERVLL